MSVAHQPELQRDATEEELAHVESVVERSTIEKKASNIVITQISLERLSENSADVIACSQEQTREIGVVNRDAMSWALSTFSTNNNVTNEQLPQVLQEAEDDSDK